MEARYNLISGRRECHIPVQVQLASDEGFLMALKGSLDLSHIGQVFSEHSDSKSDIDISGLLNHSEPWDSCV